MLKKQLTLKNYQEILPAGLLKKTAKILVRECDQIEKGHYQAYADENEQSYDVSMTINSEGEITAQSCDCGNKISFCRHELALLLHITQGKKQSGPRKSRKKQHPLEILVSEAEPEKLKAWLVELLLSNKDIGLAFTNHFSLEQKQYEPAEVRQLTLEAVKSVVKNKKKLEMGEVKKIVDLWGKVHDSIVKQYLADVTDEIAFLNLDALLDTCEEIQYRVATNSIKIKKYPEIQLSRALEPFHHLQTDRAWDIATAYLADRICGERNTIRMYYLNFLNELLEISPPDRKKKLAERLARGYAQNVPHQYYNGGSYTDQMLQIVKKHGLFGTYYALFKPVTYRNDFNLGLIRSLIGIRQFGVAAQYCLEQIGGNFKQEYNFPYLFLLKEIYMHTGDNRKLSEVLTLLFPLSYDFEDFKFILAQMKDEESRNKWRTNILAKARDSADYSSHAMAFHFRVLHEEKKYDVMVADLRLDVPFSIILQYADAMAQAGGKEFLKMLLQNSQDSYKRNLEYQGEKKDWFFHELLVVLKKHYSKTEMISAINTAKLLNWKYRTSGLLDFMGEQFK